MLLYNCLYKEEKIFNLPILWLHTWGGGGKYNYLLYFCSLICYGFKVSQI